MPYRMLWTIFVLIGAITQLDFVWLVADTLNAFMAFPNLVSLLLLSPVIVQVTQRVFRDRRAPTCDGRRAPLRPASASRRRPRVSSLPSRISVGSPAELNRKTAFSRSTWPAISSRYLALKPISSRSSP